MLEVNINDLSYQLEAIITQVEKGEICIIMRGEEPVAEINPITSKKNPRWKNKIEKIVLPKGVMASDYIIEERSYR